jgi:hypothetical protein
MAEDNVVRFPAPKSIITLSVDPDNEQMLDRLIAAGCLQPDQRYDWSAVEVAIRRYLAPALAAFEHNAPAPDPMPR